ncbi:hypothetical protein GmHk_16G045498 [Glycine max]|nr:hypothetical protein GmHk_16G045498 [Glycine max]
MTHGNQHHLLTVNARPIVIWGTNIARFYKIGGHNSRQGLLQKAQIQRLRGIFDIRAYSLTFLNREDLKTNAQQVPTITIYYYINDNEVGWDICNTKAHVSIGATELWKVTWSPSH